ncbi:mechanosensitive ion channel domain-containing protein [Aureliella helgolandensis]|uniref:Miniconductance mechanosensitive channel MscM n=1 Tax=Aureliella helgolandensis TaxID=2527968 RepID=A0A518GHB5_9BACT|nr:mechanosensitive ion channel domain-containing protein [Aureliella helgolandensis]QDV27974.1 Miniconductance mechanosensitive channel MscM precursor [Aureliella helgolandensis]
MTSFHRIQIISARLLLLLASSLVGYLLPSPQLCAQAVAESAAQPPAAAPATDPAGNLRSPASPTNPPAATAPPGAEVPPATTLPIDPIAGRIQEIQQRLAQTQAEIASNPDEAKKGLTDLYQKAITDLQAAQTAREKLQEWEARTVAAPQTLQTVLQQLETLKQQKDKPATFNFPNMDEGKIKVQQLGTELAAATAKRTKLTEEEAAREKRRKELPQLISDLKTLQDQQTKAGSPADAANAPAVTEALSWASDASLRSINQQILALESEQRAYEAEATLLPKQIELARSEENRLQELVKQANAQLEAIRTNRILQQRLELEHALLDTKSPANQEPINQELIKNLLQHLETWQNWTARHNLLQTKLATTNETLRVWREKRSKMDARVSTSPTSKSGGTFNSWVGLMLRKQRNELPDTDQLYAEISLLQEQMRAADALRFELDDELQTAQSQLTQEEAIQAASADNEDEPPKEARTEELLKQTIDILQAIQLDLNTHVDALYETANQIQNTIHLSIDYQEFIDKHVLFIRSSERLQSSDIPSLMEAFHWLVSLDNWRFTGALLLRDIYQEPWWYTLLVVGLGILLANQTNLRRRLGEVSTKASKNTCTQFSYTVRGILLTFLISSPLPLALLFFFWRLTVRSQLEYTMGADLQFVQAVSSSLLLTVSVFLPAELLRQLCRSNGLGIKHFGWPESESKSLGNNLRWLINSTVPLIAVFGMLNYQADARWESSLGRVVFICLMPLISISLYRIFHPQTGIFSDFLRSNSGGWLDRTSLVWFLAIVLSPILMAFTSYLGYHYTAVRIAGHFASTMWMIVALTLVYCVLTRWILLNRRRLVRQQARQRLEDAAKRDSGTAAPAVDDTTVDLITLNEQTRRLVTSVVVATGLGIAYRIWFDVLPAVDMLNSVQLWTTQGPTPDENINITLANVVLVIPILILAIIAGRNVPGLLEIALLQYLPLTKAAKYAITTMFRYAILAISIMAVSYVLGLQWASIQWLVAALGVGLGFGLQEIFANFVSGIILLFEQPLRVGDTITVDGTTGVVSKIRMRATTIINWDRQELIVPNKDLITGKLLNWTLSDTMNRIVVNVGIAYGSDTSRACDIIREICEEHPNIMSSPSPVITFEGFGDNTLNLVVRAYLESLDNRLATIHEMHQQIYMAFGTAGIEIAFPQRDLHIRSIPDRLSKWFESRS